MLSIALLDASGPHDDAPRNFRRALDASVTRFDVPDGELPPLDGTYDAGVLSGSWASVYWDLAWIGPLKGWVSDAVDRGLPLFGVCFGHQLLADVLGGEVVGRDTYELGYHEITHAPGSRLFAGVPRRFVAFTAHSDDVVSLPPGAEKLAENEYSIHAFRKGDAVGVQFHPEFDSRTAARVVEERDPSEERTPDAEATLTPENLEAAAEATRVFDNFLDAVRAASVAGD
ncbi:MAG: type 1 glutamine amidotransferase [Salinigranum sp.]